MSATHALSETSPLAPVVPPSWRGAFDDLAVEHGFQPLRIEGNLPPDLLGTLYRNGPAHCGVGGRKYQHWFDGDGAVTAVRFAGNGQVLGACHTLDTQLRAEEQRKGRMLYSTYGTSPRWGLSKILKRKNSANINVMVWQNRLFALFEACPPTELSPDDLSTLSENGLGDVVLQTFSAHPHYLRERNAAYNFGVRIGRRPMLDLFELPDVGPARRLAEIPLNGTTMIHDFIATPRHLIFFAPPLRLKVFSMLFGTKSYSENLVWKPELGTEVIVVPIDHPEQVVRFTVEAFYQWHFANAFERVDGQIMIDFVRLEDFASNGYLGALPTGGNGTEYRSRSARATLDLREKTLHTEIFSERSVEFPRISGSMAGQSHRFVYAAAHDKLEDSRLGPFPFLVKQNRETGKEVLTCLGAGQIPSEPVFVRRPTGSAEDDGWILSMTHDANARNSYLAVIDARRFEDGPVCRVRFDHPIPYSFHGNFARARAG